jgi:aspartate/methionine/tyrosine aminotransferase
MIRPAERLEQFQESLIREMTRHAMEAGAINLSQGYPDFDPPQSVVQAAVHAMQAGENQYTVTWGYPPLRRRIAEVYGPRLGWEVEADRHVTVTCGVTEGIVVAQMAVLNPGDEILIIEPAHENFRPAAIMISASPVAVPLVGPDFRLSYELLAEYVSPRTRAILLNTPHNPTGRVFDGEEIAVVTRLVTEHDLVLITDEIYEHILYDGRTHVSPGSLPALQDRTITVTGLSKTFAMTGWRLGVVIAPDALASAVRRCHDYLTICAATPLQAAAVEAMNLPAAYYKQLGEDYQARRDTLMGYLAEAGFTANTPEGAYYTIAEYGDVPSENAQLDAMRFSLWLTREVGVAVVPMTSFYSGSGFGEASVRFAFPKRMETLHEAGQRLLSIKSRFA